MFKYIKKLFKKIKENHNRTQIEVILLVDARAKYIRIERVLNLEYNRLYKEAKKEETLNISNIIKLMEANRDEGDKTFKDYQKERTQIENYVKEIKF